MGRPRSIKEALEEVLSEEELEIMPTSFDVVGSIIVFNDLPDDLMSKKNEVGEIVLNHFPNVDTVSIKTGAYSGQFRTPELEVIAGNKSKETMHKENNCRIMLNPEKTYFSVRLATERLRIADMVEEGEEILVMFSGVGPYPCVIARNSNPGYVLGIEMNPEAHRYAMKNIELNKLDNVEAINGDVREVVPNLNRKFDRVLMPLPKTAEDYLDVALLAVKKGTVVHFYDFMHEDEFDESKKKVNDACERNGFECEILDVVKCGQHAPRVYRICVDFRIV